MTRLLDILASKKPALGSYVFSSDPAVTEILAGAGFDFCIVDLEHAALEFSDAVAHIRAGDARGIPVIVRIGEHDEGLIGKLLDAGAAGIRLAHYGQNRVDSIAAALAVRYPPLGHRPACSGVRATGYGRGNFADHIALANESTVTLAIIEDIEVVDRAEEVLREGRIDMVSPGIGDLAAAAGVPGQYDHPSVQALVDSVMMTAKRLNILRGGYVRSAADLALWKRFNPDFISCSIDYRVLANAYEDLRAQLRP